MQLIKNCNVVFEDRIEKNNVIIENKKIKLITKSCDFKCDVLECDDLFLSPGFIDIHIHGTNGYDIMDNSYESINRISKIIAKSGTTSFLPTTMTYKISETNEIIHTIASSKERGTDGANIIGINLEGPFINKDARGAHKSEFIINPTIENFKAIVGNNEKYIKIITIAPEVCECREFIQYLNGKGIVASIGHTRATYDEAIKAIKFGISHSTHIFNAMPGFHHRNPGTIGAIFDSNITTEIIADGILNSFTAVRLLCNMKNSDSIIIVSDSIKYANMAEGYYKTDDYDLSVLNGVAMLKSGVLAGSTTMLNKAVKNVYKNTCLPLYEVIKMVTINPAKLCRIESKKGIIKSGFDADLILFDKNININKVIINGNLFYE
ncbi:N-acetylglucosamine-6-phosphate deacetylase [Inconstantimicrobium mannanitabidum]|uniref:N-acetylglucosamine-6-phosphate deacetylase n=1 Tax=Inconstantimicrobium mannanitabidum TaxID=1604901 RepID=A0ACB5RH20_9CLOT|nr:N-acetylglucosamine-6-phosphate deacetylase [Clostridium sp. TW13]GKX68395.1 N-acetylglucosamine-6-phosphate deacetylase [Clostridium sp. TW13]